MQSSMICLHLKWHKGFKNLAVRTKYSYEKSFPFLLLDLSRVILCWGVGGGGVMGESQETEQVEEL